MNMYDLRDEFDDLLLRYRESGTPLISRTSVRAVIWDKTGGLCWYCGNETHPFRDFSIDHIRPLSKEGDDDFDNLVPCCRSCNFSKSNRGLDYLRSKLAQSKLEIPSFTPEQCEFLKSHGIDIEVSLIEDFKFFFEETEL